MKYAVIGLFWAAYCILHSLLISTWFTNFLSRILKKFYAFYRLFYVIFSLVLLIWLINYTARFDDKIVIINYSLPWSVLRYILMYGSLLMFAWAFFLNYDPLSFFGIRQILNFKKEIKMNPDEAIKKNGLLGIIRHPMYLALIIFLWSTVFTFMDLFINSMLTVYVIIGTYLEEKKLIREFGNAYVKYQHEVPMLIPFIKTKAA